MNTHSFVRNTTAGLIRSRFNDVAAKSTTDLNHSWLLTAGRKCGTQSRRKRNKPIKRSLNTPKFP